jgi:dihydrofolate reductase
VLLPFSSTHTFYYKNTSIPDVIIIDLVKVVVSTTLSEAAWNNSRLVRDHVAEEVAQLKAQPGNDIVILGSAGLAATLTEQRLIDEYRIAINPVVLGDGTPLFRKRADRINLRLVGSRIFASGVAELRYAPDPA